jgi:hypothetical protein
MKPPDRLRQAHRSRCIMTKDRLRACSKKELEQLAKKKGIAGWHDLTKDQLIAALVRVRQAAPKPAKKRAVPKSKVAAKKKLSTAERTARINRIAAAAKAVRAAQGLPATGNQAQTRGMTKITRVSQAAAARNTKNGVVSAEEEVERSKFDVGVATKDLSARLPRDLPGGYGRDRIIVMVRDPYWLHAYWELTRAAVQRAEAALGSDWHGARPVLRVLDVSSDDTTSASEAAVRDIDIHGGCNNWYVDVQNPPRSYRVDIGYLAKNGRFYVLARSNVVTTPRAGVSDLIDENWADVQHQYEKIYAMSGGYDPTASSLELKQLFEERLRRPMGSPAVTSFGSGAFQGGKPRKFWFHLDAELIVYGATEPNAKVTLQGEPVSLRPDGTFTMRFSLPDARQIIPSTAVSHDGVEERTIVLAVERNTKSLEPMIHDSSENN